MNVSLQLKNNEIYDFGENVNIILREGTREEIESAVHLFGWWWYDYRGFICDRSVDYHLSNQTPQTAAQIILIKSLNTTEVGTMCYSQEISSGLRMHPEEAFPLSIRCSSESVAEQLTLMVRNFMEARVPHPVYHPLEKQAATRLTNHIKDIFTKFPEPPYNLRPVTKTMPGNSTNQQ